MSPGPMATRTSPSQPAEPREPLRSPLGRLFGKAQEALPFEGLIALRYLSARKKAGVSITGVLTVAGVALGVWALTVVTSVWNGFEAEFLNKLLGINAHALVLKRHDVFRDHREVSKKLTDQPAIVDATPFVYSEVIVQSQKGVQGVIIKGIDPKAALRLPLARYVGEEAPSVFKDLRVLSSSTAPSGSIPGIVIGSDLQEVLHVEPGDTITIISPYGGRDGEARTAAFEVLGMFHSGMFEFDSRMVFISLRQAQKFFRLHGTVTGLEVWTDDPMKSYETLNRAVEGLDEEDPFAYEVKDWSRTNAGIFGAVRSQKSLISLMLFIIVVVAAFNIMATLILLILEKGREIAVLKSVGATRGSILTVFIIDGQLVGLIGCATGITLGLITCAVLEQYGLRVDPRVYYLEKLPIVVNPSEIAVVVVGAMFLSTVATLFPALRAAGSSPVDGLNRRPGRKAGT